MLGGAGALGVGALAAYGAFGTTRSEPGAAVGVQRAEATGESGVTIQPYAYARDLTVWHVVDDLAEGQQPPPIYSAASQAARHAALQAKRTEQNWTWDNPLIVLDPYGTVLGGLYLYFTDTDQGSLSFTTEAAVTSSFHATAANHAETGFEGLLVGLVPGSHNTLTLEWQPGDGAATTASVRIKSPFSAGGYGNQIAAEVPDPEALTPGLFAICGIQGSQQRRHRSGRQQRHHPR